MSKRQRKLEQKRKLALWNYFADGIWELYFGISAIWIGLIVRFQWPVWFVFIVVPLILIPLWLKQKFVFPHIQTLKITAQKRKGILLMGALLLLANVMILFIMKDEPGLTGLGVFLQQNVYVIGSMVIGSLTWYLAYAFGFRRLYSYGLLMFAGLFAEAWLFPQQPVGVEAFAGMIITAAGVGLFVQFLQQNPKPVIN